MIVRPQLLLLALFASLPCVLSSPLEEHIRDIETLTRTLLPTSAKTTSTSSAAKTSTTAALAERDNARTTSTIPAATVTLAAAIPTKTALKGCNVQGTANALLLSNAWSSARASDVLSCQLKCMYISQCQSYSFQSPYATRDDNCNFYHMFISRGPAGVIPSKTSGIYFSDKYPGDGSNFCYGTTEL